MPHPSRRAAHRSSPPTPQRATGGPARDRRRANARAIVLLAAVALLLFALAPSAPAAPPGPTWDLAQLGAALEDGPLDGYMLTTMQGTTPESIPLEVQSLISYSDGTLIMFEASGSAIDRIGGIAAGMSGSPVYVNSGGIDYLVGAVSYGDIFTRGGTGLATPIEYMAAIEDAYAPTIGGRHVTPRPGTYQLNTPARTGSGVVREVVIARSVAAGKDLASDSDHPVMAPLGIIQIGGARPGSPAYKRIEARFARTGMLVRAAGGDGSWSGPPTPDLTAGSPCAILFSQGAVWVGAAGTVTYVDGDSVLLFGHPFEQLGEIDALLTGGYVEGVWPSNLEPYKLIAPRDVKGACVQDRTWGVQGRLGATAEVFPAHTSVSYAGRSVEDTSAATQWLFTSRAYPDLPAEIAINVASRLVDQWSLRGSATTRTRIVVSDGSGSYTVEREDLWSASEYDEDVLWYVGMDAATALQALAQDPYGTLGARVESVSVEAELDRQQRTAYIAGVDVPGGLTKGHNEILISYYPYGSTEPHTISTDLKIPAGMPLNGRLTLTPGSWYWWEDEEDGWDDDEMTSPMRRLTGKGVGPPPTLAEVVAKLNQAPGNRDLIVSYSAGGWEAKERSVTVHTPCVFERPYSLRATTVRLKASANTVGYGKPARVSGTVSGSKNVPVSIYRHDTGKADPVLVATVTARSGGGPATFSAVVPKLHRSTTIIAVAAAGEATLAGRATVRVKVRADVRLSGGRPLQVRVRPVTSGKAHIQVRRGTRWVGLRTVRIVNGAGAVKLPKGTWRVRARFSGSGICAAGTSRPLNVVVR